MGSLSFVNAGPESFSSDHKFTSHDSIKPAEPSRPGPKPKVSPAPDSRQERNRQAQRLHRSRQVAYIRRLETEIQQLRNECLKLSDERDHFRSLYEQSTPQPHKYDHLIPPLSDTQSNASPDAGSVISPSAITPNSDTLSDGTSSSGCFSTGSGQSSGTEYGSDSEDSGNTASLGLGIDYVLSMERKCMGHILPIGSDGVNHVRTERPDGHALMISWKRISSLDPCSLPVEESNICPKTGATMNKYNLKQIDAQDIFEATALKKLLTLSSKLPLNETEMTPVAAWHFLSQHPK